MILDLLIGFLAGLTASMGLGGGLILTLYLITIKDVGQMEAQGTNLAFFLLIAVVATAINFKNKLIEKEPLLPVALFGIIGSILGVLIAIIIPKDNLRKFFSVFLLFVGVGELLRKTKK